jgi:hypothetical protein
MNYIKLLEDQNKDLSYRLTEYAFFIRDIEIYLQSSKFHNDNTVNVNDILLRIQEFKNNTYKDIAK